MSPYNQHLDPATLELALAKSRRPEAPTPAATADSSLAEWFRLQVGPIADLVWDGSLRQALREEPGQARSRLESLGIDRRVVDELLNRRAEA